MTEKRHNLMLPDRLLKDYIPFLEEMGFPSKVDFISHCIRAEGPRLMEELHRRKQIKNDLIDRINYEKGQEKIKEYKEKNIVKK